MIYLCDNYQQKSNYFTRFFLENICLLEKKNKTENSEGKVSVAWINITVFKVDKLGSAILEPTTWSNLTTLYGLQYDPNKRCLKKLPPPPPTKHAL